MHHATVYCLHSLWMLAIHIIDFKEHHLGFVILFIFYFKKVSYPMSQRITQHFGSMNDL